MFLVHRVVPFVVVWLRSLRPARAHWRQQRRTGAAPSLPTICMLQCNYNSYYGVVSNICACGVAYASFTMAAMATATLPAIPCSSSSQWHRMTPSSDTKSTRMVSAALGLGLGSSSSSLRGHPRLVVSSRPWAAAAGVDTRSSRRGRGSSVSVQAVSRPADKPRFIQHKQEAFWFYRFLSIVYDHVINPGHWTEDMREDALEPADLNDRNLVVVDVGGGTGFATLGIVKTVDAKNVTILDQSPHQLAKAKEKAPLKECKIIEGDAEDLVFETDYADRYVSAGSIEYWPDPQRGITEAYRVLKKGGKACLIGPVHPTFWLSRFFADVWMLFPTEEEYIDWFTKAGFTDVKLKRIGPSWYRGVRRHGLIMGCSVTGVKPESGPSPLELGPIAEDVKGPWNPFSFLYRFLIGNLAAFYYVMVPIYMWIKDLIVPKGQPI